MHVLDGAGQQLHLLGPLPAPVTAVAWAGTEGDLLLAAAGGSLHTWLGAGAAPGPVLPLPGGSVDAGEQQAAPRLAPAPCGGAPLLAAAAAVGAAGSQEVLCWDLSSLSSDGGGAPQPLCLTDFEGQVRNGGGGRAQQKQGGRVASCGHQQLLAAAAGGPLPPPP